MKIVISNNICYSTKDKQWHQQNNEINNIVINDNKNIDSDDNINNNNNCCSNKLTEKMYISQEPCFIAVNDGVLLFSISVYVCWAGELIKPFLVNIIN